MKTFSLLSAKSKVAFGIACLSLTIFAASCKKSDPVEIPVGDLQIRAINTVAGSNSQDLLVNTAVKATAVSYGNASPYVTITSGISTVGFYDTGTNTTANTGGQVDFPIGAKASIFYIKVPAGTLSAILLNDATTAATTGKAKVRFLHLNNFLGTTSTISVAVDGTATSLVPSATYAEPSSYFEVDPGAKFNFTGAGVIAGAAFDGGLVAGKVYTIWIDGTAATNLNGHIFAHN